MGERKMNRVAKTWVVVALVACIGFGGVISADSAYYYVGVYKFNYKTTAQLALAKKISPYLSSAYSAAKSSLGGVEAIKGSVTISFYSATSNTHGYSLLGYQNIYLNSYNNLSGATWGEHITMETTRILFCNFTNSSQWNKSLLYYRTFLTESFAFYAKNVLFRYGPKLSALKVKSYLKEFYGITKQVFSWTDSAYYFLKAKKYGDLYCQAGQQFISQGYFFHGLGRTKVVALLNYLRSYSQRSSYYLRSSNFYTAENYFETSFYKSFSRKANAAWTYTGNYNYKDTKYLYGSYWYSWYN